LATELRIKAKFIYQNPDQTLSYLMRLCHTLDKNEELKMYNKTKAIIKLNWNHFKLLDKILSVMNAGQEVFSRRPNFFPN